MIFGIGRLRAKKLHQEKKHWLTNAEASLRSHFVPWVNNLSLRGLIAPEISESALERYQFIPILSGPDQAVSTTSGIYSFTLPAGITIEKTKHDSLYLDTSHAIGLVYLDKLQAVSAAHLSALGGLVIKQNQAVVGPRNSGLYGGFHWQDPLVKGWMMIGEKLNVPRITVQGSRNNTWATKLGIQLLKQELAASGQSVLTPLTPDQIAEAHTKGAAVLAKNYDDVADRLGFSQLPNGNWQLGTVS